MAVYKEEKTNTWRAVYRYTDWNGERKQTQKRGFKTKREAQAWEREQLNKTSADLDMTFKSFVDLYTADMKTRLKENTWAIRTLKKVRFPQVLECCIGLSTRYRKETMWCSRPKLTVRSILGSWRVPISMRLPQHCILIAGK